jgi:hypothetical protein
MSERERERQRERERDREREREMEGRRVGYIGALVSEFRFYHSCINNIGRELGNKKGFHLCLVHGPVYR